MLQYVARDGFPTAWHAMNAGRYAAGGAGLVIMESTKVERRGRGTVGDLGLWDDRYIEPLSRIVEAIKSSGAAAGIQLGHAGRKGKVGRPWEGGRPLAPDALAAMTDAEAWDIVAPSAVSFGDGFPVPRALQTHEIASAIAAWGTAAARADQAGFDAIEIHAAHGYLIHSFLSPAANRRTDAYGGSDANRMRFALEVVEAVRAVWPASKPLFLRLSVEDGAGWSVADSVRLARLAGDLGVDVVDCSSGGISADVPTFFDAARYGYQVPLSEQVRRHAGILTMAVGHIVHGDQAEDILQRGRADLVAVGRESIHNPNWAMDAAQKLGADPGFASVPPQMGYWLAKRAARGFGGNPSTWRSGIEEDAATS